MIELSRVVRFAVNAEPPANQTERDNTFSGWPAVAGLGRFFELEVVCRGQADPQTGYFVNIKEIDTAVRDAVQPMFVDAVRDEWRFGRSAPLGELLRASITALNEPLNQSVARVAIQLSPFLRVAMEAPTMDRVLLAQQFDFSAAHRLHVPQYDDATNRDIFGKCNNPAGHGHNYRVEVVLDVPVDEHGCTLTVDAFDRIVNGAVIDELDHKHLNLDVPAFADLNPSVEHIVKVVWSMLAGVMPAGCVLSEVSVWETAKTRCTYRGPASRN